MQSQLKAADQKIMDLSAQRDKEAKSVVVLEDNLRKIQEESIHSLDKQGKDLKWLLQKADQDLKESMSARAHLEQKLSVSATAAEASKTLSLDLTTQVNFYPSCLTTA